MQIRILAEEMTTKPTKYTIEKSGKGLRGYFEIDNNKYIIYFRSNDGNEFDFSFNLMDGSIEASRITGTGNANKVFSTVLDFLKEAIKRKDPKEIRFATYQPSKSRKSLYNRLIKRIKELYPGYEGKKEDDNEFVIVKSIDKENE